MKNVKKISNWPDPGGQRCDMSQIIHFNASVNSNWVHPPGQPPGISSKKLPGDRDLTFESCPGAENSTRAGILWKFEVKRFVRVLVLLVINTWCPKIAKKWGTLHC